jgi:hypothetical protein
MTLPRHKQQMTEHTLEAPKGWPNPHAVDFNAVYDPTELASLEGLSQPAYAGRCVHNTATGYKMGAIDYQMPMWIFQNSDDTDVSNAGGSPTTDVHVWVPVAPTGVMMALVAAGAYELATTEFVDATYAANDPLYAETAITLADRGKLTKTAATAGTYPDTSIVGVVSRGTRTNSHRKAELMFWPVYLPSHSH